MNPTWNMEEARQLVKGLYGEEQLELARSSLGSVVHRRDHANVHWHSARNVLRQFAKDAKKQPLFTMAWSGDDGVRGRYYWKEQKAQAYAIALAQSLHAIPDIYAHALYYSLALNKGPNPIKKDRDINATRVIDKLVAPDLTKLRDLFAILFEDDDFKHMAAISNRSKHRSVVQPNVHEDYSGVGERVRLEFPAFTHGGKSFVAVEVRAFSEGVYNHCAKSIVDIGNELNAVLRARLAALPI